MTDVFWRRFFVAAALFNVAAGLPALLAPARALETFGMPPLPNHLFMQTTSLLVLTFGLGYWMVSRRLALRELVWLGVVGKAGVVILFAWAWMQGSISTRFAVVGMGDLFFVIAFLVFLATRRGQGST